MACKRYLICKQLGVFQPLQTEIMQSKCPDDKTIRENKKSQNNILSCALNDCIRTYKTNSKYSWTKVETCFIKRSTTIIITIIVVKTCMYSFIDINIKQFSIIVLLHMQCRVIPVKHELRAHTNCWHSYRL